MDAIFRETLQDFVDRHPQLSQQDLQRYILDYYSYKNQLAAQELDPQDSAAVLAYLWSLYRRELAKKQEFLKTEEKLEEFLRLSVLRAIDEAWIEQVDSLQQLKSFVPIRQVAQRDMTSEYFRESLESYNQMAHRVKEGIVRNVMLSTIEADPEKGHTIYFV